MAVFPHLALDIVSHELRFISSCAETPQMDLGPLAAVCPKGFRFALCVIADHGVRCIQNVLCGAVILLELDHQSIRVYFFKIQYVADVGSAEPVDGLVVVSDHAQISVLIRQEPDQLKLRIVGVLVFVHHDIPETVLVICQHFVV